MTEIRFYHLQTEPLEKALPKLLLKAYGAGKKIIIRGENDQQIQQLDTILWTFHPNHFLPHGSKKTSKHAALQPIWLTTGTDNPNAADTLILATRGADIADDLKEFALVCDMFNGFDEASVTAARARWKACKAAGFDLTYWQQTETGGWDEKAKA